MSTFSLDSRLEADCIRLGELPLSQLLLMDDASYPWFILVPRRPGIREIFELAPDDRRQLWEESTQLAEGMSRVLQPDKINIAALGNVVPQLHLHHVARYIDDRAWPGPVWGAGAAVPYRAERVAEIRSLLGSMLPDTLELAPVTS
jgi:diadenosine tetraphosphate (Ap4A) HIT family hydrolase